MTQSPSRPNPLPEVEATPLALRVIGADRLSLFKQQIARGWKRLPTDAELEMMALYFESGHYDPWARPPQLIFTLRWDQNAGGEVLTPQKTIDGLRLDAARSRDYLNQVGPQWCGSDGVWVDVWLRKEPPAAARVGVQRRGATQPTWSVALYSEWVQTSEKNGQKVPTSFWRDKPAHMLAKTAETMSLKRALPNETDPLAQEHMRELERLAMPQAAALHERIFGNKDRSPYDLGGYIPTRERLVEDRPRPALNDGGDLVDQNTGEVLREAEPAQPALSAPLERTLGDLHEDYGRLLSVARREGAIPDGQVHDYLLPQGADRETVKARGKALKAIVETHRTATRNKQTLEHAHSVEYAVSPEDEELAEAGADDDDSSAQLSLTPTPADSTVTSVNDDDYQALAGAIAEAARVEVEYDDCRIQLPCPRDEVQRKRKILDFRVQAVKTTRAERVAAG